MTADGNKASPGTNHLWTPLRAHKHSELLKMPTQGQSPPATKARVILHPLKTQKSGSTPEKLSPEMKKRKRAEEEDKEAKQETRPDPEKRRTTLEIRQQAKDIEKKILAYCLDPSKKINKDQTATIMRHFTDMRGLLEDLLLENSFLNGRLEQSIEAEQKNTEILSAVNKSLQASKRLKTAVKKTTTTEQRQPTYAEKVGMTSNKVGQISVKPPKNVVIIRPEQEDSSIKTSEEALDAVFTLVNPRKKGIQVTAVRKIGGNGLVVETAKPESLKEFTENAKLKEAGLKTSTPQRRPPRMILFDVPRDIPEQEIQNCIKKQNQDRLTEDDVAAIKFCFKTGRKDAEETNWVLEVPPR
jgi:hypothetical protein